MDEKFEMMRRALEKCIETKEDGTEWFTNFFTPSPIDGLIDIQKRFNYISTAATLVAHADWFLIKSGCASLVTNREALKKRRYQPTKGLCIRIIKQDPNNPQQVFVSTQGFHTDDCFMMALRKFEELKKNHDVIALEIHIAWITHLPEFFNKWYQPLKEWSRS